jgi:hypothetical protein
LTISDFSIVCQPEPLLFAMLKLGLAANATAAGNGMKSSNYGVFGRGPTGHLDNDAAGE